VPLFVVQNWLIEQISFTIIIKVNDLFKKIQQIFDHQGFKKYFFNTGWLMAEKLFKMLAGLLVGIWVARYLGPKQFGIFSYVVAFTGLFTPLRKLGLDGIITRDVARDELDNNELLSSSAFFKFLGSLILLVLVSGYMYFFKNNTIYFYLSLIFSFGFMVRSYEVIEFYFRAKVKGKYISIAHCFGIFVASLLKILFILSECSLVYFALANLVEAMVSMMLLWIFLKSHPCVIAFSKVRIRKGFELLKESWPLIFSGFFALVYLNIDQVMIEEMLGSYEVGQYSVAVRISSVWYFIPLTIGWSVQAAIVNARKNGPEVYNERLQLLFTITAVIAYSIILPVVLFSDWIILVLFGPDYSSAGDVLSLHMWASLFVFIGSARGLWVLNESFFKFALFANIGAGIINVSLNYILLPIYGINGAAFGTVVSYAFSFFLSGFFFPSARKVAWMQTKSLFLIDLFVQLKKMNKREIYE